MIENMGDLIHIDSYQCGFVRFVACDLSDNIRIFIIVFQRFQKLDRAVIVISLCHDFCLLNGFLPLFVLCLFFLDQFFLSCLFFCFLCLRTAHLGGYQRDGSDQDQKQYTHNRCTHDHRPLASLSSPLSSHSFHPPLSFFFCHGRSCSSLSLTHVSTPLFCMVFRKRRYSDFILRFLFHIFRIFLLCRKRISVSQIL